MNTTTKKKNSFIGALIEMFKTGDDETYESLKSELPDDLKKTLADLKKEEEKIQKSIVFENKSENKVDFANEINPKTKAAMRKMYNEAVKEDKNKEDNSRDER